MSALWLKELRAALPFLCLVIILPALGLVYELFTGLPNLKPLEATYEDYVTAHEPETRLIFFLLCMALTSGLLIREYDEGTLKFLDSLPVSRTRIFITKFGVALIVVLAYILLDVGTALMLHAFSRDSLHQAYHLQFCLTAVGLRCCVGFVLLSFGLLCSYLRRFGWLLMGLLFWLYILLHESLPWMAVLNVFSSMTPVFEGQHWTVPGQQLILQVTIGVLLLLSAYGLFLGAGDVLVRGLQRLTQNRIGNAILIIGGGAVCLLAFTVFFYIMESTADESQQSSEDVVTIEYPSWSTSRASTKYYNFVYPSNLENRALRLVSSADEVYERVQEFFDAEAGNQVMVDATNALPRHAGVAHWDKILLDLTVTEHVPTLEAILGHETSHVFLSRLSDNRLDDQFESTRFFHEGVATFIEHDLFQPHGGIDRWRRVAAVMRARNEVRFEELVEDSALTARVDHDLVYTLGEVFVAEIVEQYGKPAVGTLARAFVRKDAPEGLAGMQLWRDVFQACNLDLESVLDGFYARLDREVERHADLIQNLPRPRASIETQSGFVVLQVLEQPPQPWRVVCRFRQQHDSPPRSYMEGAEIDPGLFIVERENFPSSIVWYQLGLTHPDAYPIFESWMQIRLRD